MKATIHAHDGRWYYSPHSFERAQGHLFIDTLPSAGEPCTITLNPAASADQEWMNEKGELIARAVNAALAVDCEEIREALEGDSNDAEHDALAAVAEALNITYNPPED